MADCRSDKRLTAEDLTDVNWYMEISAAEISADTEPTIPEKRLVLADWRFGISGAGMYCVFRLNRGSEILSACQLMAKCHCYFVQEVEKMKGLIWLGRLMCTVSGGVGMLRGLANMHKMLQDNSNHDYEHMNRKLQDETIGTQFFMKLFTIV